MRSKGDEQGGLEGGEPIVRMLCEKKKRFSIRGIKVKIKNA